MKVNFNGMRKTATADMNKLYEAIKELLADYDDMIFTSDQQELIEAFDNAAQSVDMFNCIFDDNVDGDIDDLSELSIKRLGE